MHDTTDPPEGDRQPPAARRIPVRAPVHGAAGLREHRKHPAAVCAARAGGGPHKGELLWEKLRHWRVLRVLHNPRYAGAFCFGRTRTHKRPGERTEIEQLPRDEWIALLPMHTPATSPGSGSRPTSPGCATTPRPTAPSGTRARRRFMEADPGNRLVVDVLEAEWNEKLRALHDAQEELEHRRTQDHKQLGEEQRRQILALATDFPRLWKDPRTPQRERKRMVRLLLEDVTLTKGDEIHAGVRFRGGAIQSLTLPLAQPAWQLRQTSAAAETSSVRNWAMPIPSVKVSPRERQINNAITCSGLESATGTLAAGAG